MKKANDWINHLKLQPHPEGGYFKEVYRAPETIPQHALPTRFKGERSFSTSIYFLLTQTEFSAFHRIQQDELWHFYEGSPLTIHCIDTQDNYSYIQLGRNFLKGEVLQAVVKAGVWFASSITAQQQPYSLVGCTVAPGFDFADFELAKRNDLLTQFPQHHDLICSLTRIP